MDHLLIGHHVGRVAIFKRRVRKKNRNNEAVEVLPCFQERITSLVQLFKNTPEALGKKKPFQLCPT